MKRTIEHYLLAAISTLALVAILFGCATLPGSTGLTCDTANATLKESQKMLKDLKAQGIVDGDAVLYWTVSQRGASLYLTANGCGSGK